MGVFLHKFTVLLGLMLAVLAVGDPGRAGAEPAGEDSLSSAAPRADSTGTDAAFTPRVLVLESIEIAGGTRTPKSIVLEYIALSPGDEVTVEALESSRERLLATDYFKSVEFSTRPGATRGAVVLVVDVEDRGFPTFETGFGYDDLQGWFLTLLGLRFDNTFGIESQFRMGLRLGFRIAGIDGEWRTAAPPGGGIGFDARFHVYNQRHLFFGSGPEGPEPWSGDEWRRFEQDIARAGAEAGLRYEIRERTQLSFGLQAETNEPKGEFKERDTDGGGTKDEFPAGDLPPALADDLEKAAKTGVYFRAIRDTRDDDAYPLTGSFARLTLEANSELLGGDYIFTRLTGDVRKHVPLGGGRVFSSRAAGGILTEGAPYYDRFYIGGNYTIRGFEEWSLSSTEGDDGYWFVNAEIRAPLAGARGRQPRLTGLLFFDAGQSWRRGESLTASVVESAIGYGFRLRLPWVGTLGLDGAVPLTEGRTGDPFRVHLLLGFSF
jgi:outer membrane protein insertion porin family